MESSPGKPRIENRDTAPLWAFPDFLVIGPQRTGTTWLYHNLKKHPQVFLPRQKETYYFSTLGRPEHRFYRHDTLEEFLETHMVERPRYRLKRHYDCLRYYGELYRPAVRGEATATNALLPGETIRELVALRPDLKAILMLRDPLERAWSHARKDLVRKHGREPESVPQEDYARFFRASGQRALASFSAMMRTWSGELKPGHLFVGEFEMIESAPRELLLALQQFLGVRSGERYFNRHLGERINPSSVDTTSRPSNIPGPAREYLEELLAEELADYEELKSRLQAQADVRGGELFDASRGIGRISRVVDPEAWREN